MVDPNGESKNRERRIKALIGRTPIFIKSKFMSVVGSSNDLINGISNRVGKHIILCNNKLSLCQRH